MHSNERQETSEQLTDAVLEFTEGIGIIKTYNILGEKSKNLSDSFIEHCKKNLNYEKSHSIWSKAINLTYALGTVLMLFVLCILYKNDAMTLSLFLGALLFTFELFGPLKAFYSQTARLTVMSACLDRIEEVFEEEELNDSGKEHFEQNDKQDDKQNECEIEFKNVSFAYDKNEIIKNVSFKVYKNTMTALVGPSGAGKSTIANLLARFWDIQQGEILIKGKNIKNVSLATLWTI